MKNNNRFRLLFITGGLLLLLIAGIGCRQRASVEDYRRFAFHSAERGLWEEAQHRWEKALELKPGDGGLLNNLAVASEAQGDLSQAGELYEAAVAAAPDDDSFRDNLLAFRRANPELFPIDAVEPAAPDEDVE